MRRTASPPRPDWQARCEEAGLSFHSVGGLYWNESATYCFTTAQIHTLRAASVELHQRCLDAVDWVIRERHYAPFRLPDLALRAIEASWRRRDPGLYGRFDFSWAGEGPPKLLEYNADTPGSLLESGLLQQQWQQQVHPGAGQFNQIFDMLVRRWQALPPAPMWHFTAMRGHVEDEVNVRHLQETARAAGLQTCYLPLEDIGYDMQRGCFVDTQLRTISHCCKLYPWEWLVQDAFAEYIESSGISFVEPAWKLLMSSKALLPILWQLFPEHPNLLPASFRADLQHPYVRKPLYSRQGCNIQIVAGANSLHSSGPYASGDVIHQAYAPLPAFDGRYPLLGVWMVGDEPAGLGIREDHSLITRQTCHFVPHLIDG